VLNRLYIVIGILAIVVLTAAFVVPRFITWGDYRDRMEAVVAEALGAPVRINGAIDFALLPEPRLQFADVEVGPQGAPLASVARVEAVFSLLDFLRDSYTINTLTLGNPALRLNVDAQGRLESPFNLPEAVTASNIAIGTATLVGGSIELADARDGRTLRAQGVDGELRLTAVRGPFAFQGQADFEGRRYSVRASTTQAMDDDGGAMMNAFVRPLDGGFSLSADGLLTTGIQPAFNGNLIYRQSPPPASAAQEVRGDLVFDTKVEANPTQILLAAFTMTPDESRSATRLTGQALIRLGAEPAFDAALSSGIMALAPPNVVAQDNTPQPYALVQLLKSVAVPPIPAIPGTIKVNLSEFDLRAFVARDVRLDAATDGASWTLRTLTARLPGEANLRLEGKLNVEANRPIFDGHLALDAARLDGLAQGWRRTGEINALVNLPGSLNGRVQLGREAASLTDAALTLNGVRSQLAVTLGLGTASELTVEAQLGALNGQTSSALLALLPNTVSDPAFNASFASVRLDVTAQSAVLDGMAGRGLELDGSWDPTGISLRRLAAADLDGAKFEINGRMTGTLAAPAFSGAGTISLPPASTTLLDRLASITQLAPELDTTLRRVLPLDAQLTLSVPDTVGGQTLAVTGTAGPSTLTGSARLTRGLPQALAAPAELRLTLSADDGAALSRQLGLGTASLFSEDHMDARFSATGIPRATLKTDLSLSSGPERLDYSGDVSLADLAAVRGAGALDFALDDAGGLAGLFGAQGVTLPPVNGRAQLAFTGAQTLTLSAIDARSGPNAVTGDLTHATQGGDRQISGSLQLGPIDVTALAGLLAGPAALIPDADAIWPSGPLDLGSEPRTSRGRIRIEAPAIASGSRPLARDASFDLVWDETSLRLRGLDAGIGGGRVTLDLGLCCAGASAQKQLTGRATLDAVALDDMLPPLAAETLGGTLGASARFEATGATIGELVASLAGEGSFTLDGLSVEKLDPATFSAMAAYDDVLNAEPEDLRDFVALALDRGPFQARAMGGTFTLAGGTLRTANLAAQSANARLFGGASLDLRTMALGGSFTLTPERIGNGLGLLDETTALVTANLTGTLLAPDRTLDLAAMVDGIKVRAFEQEVERLEDLRAQDEARNRAAAQEQARLAEEQAQAVEQERQQAERLARQQDEARRAAQEAAARRAAEQAAARQRASQPLDLFGAPQPIN